MGEAADHRLLRTLRHAISSHHAIVPHVFDRLARQQTRTVVPSQTGNDMAPLGALSQAWTTVEASLPHGWQLAGLYRFDDIWVARSEGPEFEDHLSGSGLFAEQAMRNLSYRLRE